MFRTLFAACLVLTASSARADEVALYAAGSLRDALSAVVADFTAKTGVHVQTTFGPSGLLREKIESGDKADIFASADMASPLKLREEGKAAGVVMFTRNKLCAFAGPDAGLTTDNFRRRIVDPAVKIGTSTPKADPGGDYTWAMFHAIDKDEPGAFATLDAKAQKIVGGTTTASGGPDPIAAAFQSSQINVMIGYCSGADQRREATPGVNVVAVPQAYDMGPEYGLALASTENRNAVALMLAILSPEGQETLARYGFAPVGVMAKP
ncbi:molybdate ABC transporter substrate-binding protein [Methylovirgula sp. 4M-Z18]|uniref:molybdate ABC transporter substrate-binding protein n=1 Tax=Methylovirgula sp. 4M-Z18 TaxID=2293567 RepID=UPI000E2F180A|nr:molybdate ABC transporter substrate-binding protein [Methylovirgula sp. 4M-Z18]RFB75583.1 molybdate ABC transporter substrate-binding protein [Methylovirgula sp. 4M-Z18]